MSSICVILLPIGCNMLSCPLVGAGWFLCQHSTVVAAAIALELAVVLVAQVQVERLVSLVIVLLAKLGALGLVALGWNQELVELEDGWVLEESDVAAVVLEMGLSVVVVPDLVEVLAVLVFVAPG